MQPYEPRYIWIKPDAAISNCSPCFSPSFLSFFLFFLPEEMKEERLGVELTRELDWIRTGFLYGSRK